jgi:hypothetical protein
MSRQVLIPNFLQSDPWTTLVSAIDSVYSPNVDEPVKWLTKIREHYLLNDTTLATIEAGNLVSESALDNFDKQTTIQNIALSGVSVPNSETFSNLQLSRLLREVSTYWYQKGTGYSEDFISYVLNTPVGVVTTWTSDYLTFLTEGDPAIGTPVYSGGTWYPTTHVQFSFDPLTVLPVPLSTILTLFLTVCNYNLVIHSAALEVFLAVAQSNQSPQTYPGSPGAPAYSIAMYHEIDVVIGNP